MSAAFEVSPDDPQGVADAIRRAAEGATVHVVRDGAPVADIVPAQHADADRRARGRQIEARQASRFGAPSIEDFRALYSAQGWPWPGDEVIRREHVVAEAS